jgi:cephalosporin hydroxylase
MDLIPKWQRIMDIQTHSLVDLISIVSNGSITITVDLNCMRQTYKDIDGRMCDFHDYYHKVAKSLPNKCRVVEVGVADGHSAIFLAETLTDLGKDFEMYLVESMDYGGDVQANTIMRNIVKSGMADKITLVQAGSLEASCKWPDGWAHFVFIDASHRYEETKADAILWYRKVMDGGILAGHDMNPLEGNEVWRAIHEVMPTVEIIGTEKGLGIWQVKK